MDDFLFVIKFFIVTSRHWNWLSWLNRLNSTQVHSIDLTLVDSVHWLDSTRLKIDGLRWLASFPKLCIYSDTTQLQLSCIVMSVCLSVTTMDCAHLSGHIVLQFGTWLASTSVTSCWIGVPVPISPSWHFLVKVVLHSLHAVWGRERGYYALLFVVFSKQENKMIVINCTCYNFLWHWFAAWMLAHHLRIISISLALVNDAEFSVC